jgi:hypothetical protein
MVVYHAGRCLPSVQHGAEASLQGHDSFYAADEETMLHAPSTLRALLVLSGAASSNDPVLKRTTDAEIAATSAILTMLPALKPSTQAA